MRFDLEIRLGRDEEDFGGDATASEYFFYRVGSGRTHTHTTGTTVALTSLSVGNCP